MQALLRYIIKATPVRRKPVISYVLPVLCATMLLQSVVYSKLSAQTLSPERLRQISFVLNRLDSQQTLATRDPVFLAGSYPSYIHHRKHFKKKKKDITVFFNILVDMTLKSVRPALPDSLQIKIDTLLRRSAAIYPRFYNKERGSYNFWLRDSAYRFPYSWWIPILKKDGAVPDDMDDTVLSRFAGTKDKKDSLELLHRRMQGFVHRPGKKLRTALKEYRHYPTYSTWFGKKFPVVLDAAVLSNILSFVGHYNLVWTRADSAALRFIVRTIRSGDYIERPLAVSPYYGQTAILLYHYSRLMQQISQPVLDSLRPDLIEECHFILGSRKKAGLMEKVIAANALIQLGAPAPVLPLPTPQDWTKKVEQSDFAYFIGNIPSYMSRGIQRVLNPVNGLMYYHYCPALNDALVLQYLVTGGR